MANNLATKLIPQMDTRELDRAKSFFSSKFKQVEEDQFLVISDWIHFAILELMKTRGFESDASIVARRLSVHVEEVRSALQRLQRLGFIQIKNRKWILSSANNTWTDNKSTSDARKNLQKKFLTKAIEGIENISFDDRDNGSLTVAINKKSIPAIKNELREIRLRFNSFIERQSGPKDEVYQLVTAFFPLTVTLKQKFQQKDSV
jgi:uncharacterized protein (TIGR02147 family)